MYLISNPELGSAARSRKGASIEIIALTMMKQQLKSLPQGSVDYYK